VDFRDAVTGAERAGLEAALEAAGLLDAWVSPDGCLQAGDGGVLLHDTQVLARPPLTSSLADWLQPAVPHDSAVEAGVVTKVLSGIACGHNDATDAEAWVAPDGRFRLGALAGAWAKPAAVHVGHTARAAARAQRLAEIADRLARLAEELGAVRAAAEQVARDRIKADEEWRHAPADDSLRLAHLAVAAAAREVQIAQARLAEAEDRRRIAEQAWKIARDRFVADALDMRLPESLEALLGVESALNHYSDGLGRLAQAAHELRLAVPELLRHRLRENEARADVTNNEERLACARTEWEEASARLEALRHAVGAKVDDLKQQLAQAAGALHICDGTLAQARKAASAAGEARAVATEKVTSARDLLDRTGETRALAVGKWQQFVATGLFAAAIPDLELPDTNVPWTIDPALTLARRAEQALSNIKHDDEAWSRVQKQMNDELPNSSAHSARWGTRPSPTWEIGGWSSTSSTRIDPNARIASLRASLTRSLNAPNCSAPKNAKCWRTICRRRSLPRSSVCCGARTGRATRSTRNCTSARPRPEFASVWCGRR
jgi:hypothetical protein